MRLELRFASAARLRSLVGSATLSAHSRTVRLTAEGIPLAWAKGDGRAVIKLRQHRMKACAAILGALLCACIGAATPAHGAGPAIDATLVGTATWAPAYTMLGCDSDPATTFQIAGTYSGNGFGTGSYSGTIARTSTGLCPSVDTPGGPFGPGPDFSVAGTLTFVGNRGSFVAVLGADSVAHAATTPHTTGYSFVLSLTIREGTRGFGQKTGTFTLIYGSEIIFDTDCPCLPQDFGTLSGSLSSARGPAS
jgi:hypothetical protein